MKKRNSLIFLISIWLLAQPAACISPETESPAPGCRQSFGMGGCNGKTIIKDVTFEPRIDCLVISGDNCNGGILDVHNDCDEDLTINDHVVPAGKFTSFDVIKDAEGQYDLVVIDHNISIFIPEQDMPLTFEANLGEQQIDIHFVKSAPYCD